MTTPNTAEVRKWARENSVATADRGRLPRSVLDAYAAAHADAGSDRAKGRSRSSSSQEPTPTAKPKPKPKPTAKPKTPSKTHSKVTAKPTAPPEAKATPTASATPTAVSAEKPGGQDVEERLHQVETQLADAVARLTALESRTLRSLLGLRITL